MRQARPDAYDEKISTKQHWRLANARLVFVQSDRTRSASRVASFVPKWLSSGSTHFMDTKAPKLIVLLAAALLTGCATAYKADRKLAALAPQIASISVYDVQGDSIPSSLDTTPSASFPVEVFTRSASSASSDGGYTIWKGSSLAIITMRDGTQRRARFSYYGNFFTLEGVSRRYTIRGNAASEFQDEFQRIIQEQFVPKRYERNAIPNKSVETNRRSASPERRFWLQTAYSSRLHLPALG
jgi:hypothetical protein